MVAVPGILLGALVLGACAPAPAPAPTGSAAAPAAPTTPAPTITPEPGLPAPSQAFDGDCSTVFTATEISGIAGWKANDPVAFVNSIPDMALVHQVGGVGCVWSSTDGSNGYLQATVVPQEELSPQLENGTTCFVQTGKTYICAVDVESNGFHLSANLTTADNSSAPKAAAASKALADLFDSRAATAGDAVVPDPGDDAWPLSFGCDSLAKRARVGKSLDNPKLVLSDGGGDVQVTAAETDLWDGRPFLRCYWQELPADPTRISQLTVAVLGGAAWAQADVAALAGAEEVEIDGVDRAIIVHDADASGGDDGELNVFDGVNWLVLSSQGVDAADLEKAVPGLLKAMDAIAR